MSTSMDLLPEIDPFSPDSLRDPLPIIDAARARAPLARSVRGVEVLTYDGCAEVYNDPNMRGATPLIAARPWAWTSPLCGDRGEA